MFLQSVGSLSLISSLATRPTAARVGFETHVQVGEESC